MTLATKCNEDSLPLDSLKSTRVNAKVKLCSGPPPICDLCTLVGKKMTGHHILGLREPDHVIQTPPKHLTNILHQQLNQARRQWKRFCALWLSLGSLGSNLGSSVLTHSVLTLTATFFKEHWLLDCFHGKGRSTTCIGIGTHCDRTYFLYVKRM